MEVTRCCISKDNLNSIYTYQRPKQRINRLNSNVVVAVKIRKLSLLVNLKSSISYLLYIKIMNTFKVNYQDQHSLKYVAYFLNNH